MYINTGGKVLGLGDEVDGYDPEADYSAPVYNPIVAPPNMPDYNPHANDPVTSVPINPPRQTYDPIGNAPAGDKTIVNTPGAAWAWAGQIFNPIIKAAVPIGTAAATRAVLGSSAVVDPKTGLPILSPQTGQPLFANSSGVVSTNPNSTATRLTASMPLIIGGAVLALVLILKKR